jgi:hypothetical protein
MYISCHSSANHRAYSSVKPLRKTFVKNAAKFFVMTLALLFAVSIGAMVQAHADSNDPALHGNLSSAGTVPVSSEHKVVVAQGDTLWDIARVHAPKGQDIRKYVEKMKQVNHMTTSALREGEILVLP